MACRSITVPTDVARVTGGTPAEFVYRFMVEGTGGFQLQLDGSIFVTIDC